MQQETKHSPCFLICCGTDRQHTAVLEPDPAIRKRETGKGVQNDGGQLGRLLPRGETSRDQEAVSRMAVIQVRAFRATDPEREG
jgi:hypothetical protein